MVEFTLRTLFPSSNTPGKALTQDTEFRLGKSQGFTPVFSLCGYPAPKYIHIGVHTTILSRLVVVTK